MQDQQWMRLNGFFTFQKFSTCKSSSSTPTPKSSTSTEQGPSSKRMSREFSWTLSLVFSPHQKADNTNMNKSFSVNTRNWCGTYRFVNVAPASILRVRASVLAPTQTTALAAGHWALVTKVRCGNVVLLEVSMVVTSLSLEIDDQ